MACAQGFGINQVVRELEKAFFCHSEFISESLNLRVFKYMRFRIESGMTILGQSEILKYKIGDPTFTSYDNIF
jgi:hypothetical protein